MKKILLTLLMLGCLKGTATQTLSESEPIVEVPVESIEQIYGTWVVSSDPTGAVSNDLLYSKSQLTLSAELYSHALDSGPIRLEGPYTVLSWDDAGGSIQTSYSRGRTNRINFSLRRNEGGAVVGFVLSEKEEGLQKRYYSSGTD